MNEKMLSGCSPAELILARYEAFLRADFDLIFDTYHSESNFHRQFEERSDYLEFGKTTLTQDYRITHCEIIESREVKKEAQVVFLMEMSVHGHVQQFAELAWLRLENGAWRYHRGQKITHDELPEDPHSLSFADFARLDPSTIF